MLGALTMVPCSPDEFASGPEPRSSSEQPAPTLGSELSFAGTQRDAWHDAPAGHAPTGVLTAPSEIAMSSPLPESTCAQPDAMIAQVASRATAPNANESFETSPKSGMGSPFFHASRAAYPPGTPPGSIGVSAWQEVPL